MTDIPDDEEETEMQAAWRRVICARCDFVELVGCMMETEFHFAKMLDQTKVETKEGYFGFHARDVAYVHHHKVGRPRGLYFRLYNGSVFDASGKEQSDTDRAVYDQLLEPDGKRRTIYDKSLH